MGMGRELGGWGLGRSGEGGAWAGLIWEMWRVPRALGVTRRDGSKRRRAESQESGRGGGQGTNRG